MIPFKQYIKGKTSRDAGKIQPMPTLETLFGNRDKEKMPTLETLFGNRTNSLDKPKFVDESVSTPKSYADEIAAHKPSEGNKIHKDNEISHVTDDQKGALERYTSIGHTSVNTSLRARKRLSGYVGDQVNHIDAALNAHTIKHPTHVYTGLHQSPIDAFHKFDSTGKTKDTTTFHHPSYLSSSTSHETAKQFTRDKNSKHILKLHVPAGAHGVSVKKLSRYPKENEMLLHRGHHIEIHHTPSIGPNGVHTWHGRIVGHSLE